MNTGCIDTATLNSAERAIRQGLSKDRGWIPFDQQSVQEATYLCIFTRVIALSKVKRGLGKSSLLFNSLDPAGLEYYDNEYEGRAKRNTNIYLTRQIETLKKIWEQDNANPQIRQWRDEHRRVAWFLT